MKKTFRTTVAVLLASVIAFGMSSVAFAASDSVEKVKWTNLFGDDYDFYFSDVALAEGENAVSVTDSGIDVMNIDEEEIRGINTVCYEFEAKQSGYYLMSSMSDTVYSVAASYNGTTANGCCDYVKYGERPYNKVFYIKEGTNLVGFTFAFESYLIADVVNIEFLGAEIKDYSLSEERLDDYIIGMNVWEDNSGEIAMATDCEVTFTPEKKLTMNDVVLMGTCSATPKEGKSKATVELFGIEKQVEFTAYNLESLVKSAEITNVGNHTVFYNDYKGEKHYENASGETITVKFNDSTEYSAVLSESVAEIILPNGVPVTAYAGLTLNSDGSYDFIISVGDVVFAKYDVTEEDKSFFDNISTLTDDNFEALRKSTDDFLVGIKYVGSDSEFMMQCFELVFDDFAQTFVNFISFIKYYIG